MQTVHDRIKLHVSAIILYANCANSDYSQVKSLKYIHSYIAIVNVPDNERVMEIESHSYIATWFNFNTIGDSILGVQPPPPLFSHFLVWEYNIDHVKVFQCCVDRAQFIVGSVCLPVQDETIFIEARIFSLCLCCPLSHLSL